MPDDDPELQHPLLSAPITNSANSIVIADLAGAIEWVNPAFSVLAGYSRAEIVGRNPRILKSGSHPKEFYEELWQTILAGRPWRGQVRNRREDRPEYIEEMTITPVRNHRGAISHSIAISQDITAFYQEVQELRANNAPMESALNLTNQGIAGRILSL